MYPGMPQVEGDVDRLASVSDTTLYKQFIMDTRRVICVKDLVWDKTAQHGQLRELDLANVNYYVSQLLTKGPPDAIFTCWTKQTAGVHLLVPLFCIAFECSCALHFLRISIRK